VRLTLRALSALLAYPSAELQENIGEIRAVFRQERALPRKALERLEPLLQSFEQGELLDLQADYSELFDRSRSLSLHLFEHVHGDSRERGQALIDLGQHYIDHGFAIEVAELPDFVPLFLEFLSCSDPVEAHGWLNEPAHVFQALQERLEEHGSAYAAIFLSLLALTKAKPDRQAVADLQERYREEQARSIDEEWEDAPVDFSAPLHPGGGPTGVVAKIRAARRAVGQATKS